MSRGRRRRLPLHALPPGRERKDSSSSSSSSRAPRFKVWSFPSSVRASNAARSVRFLLRSVTFSIHVNRSDRNCIGKAQFSVEQKGVIKVR